MTHTAACSGIIKEKVMVCLCISGIWESIPPIHFLNPPSGRQSSITTLLKREAVIFWGPCSLGLEVCFQEETQRLLSALLASHRPFRTGSGHGAPRASLLHAPHLPLLVRAWRKLCVLSAPPFIPPSKRGTVFHSSLCVTGSLCFL